MATQEMSELPDAKEPPVGIPSTPEEIADHLQNMLKREKLTSNRSDLVNHLTAIFNQAHENFRAYKNLRIAFLIAVSLPVLFQNQLPPNFIQNHPAKTLMILNIFASLGLIGNRLLSLAATRAYKIARLANERTQKAIGLKKDIFEAEDFISYENLYVEAKNNYIKTHGSEVKQDRLINISLVSLFGLSTLHVLNSSFEPKETQPVQTQHIIIDNLPNILKLELEKEFTLGKWQCVVTDQTNSKKEATLVLDCNGLK